MRRILWLSLALPALLLAACGAGDDEDASELETDGLPGRAPPAATVAATATAEAPLVATVTPTASAEAPGGLGERLDEMTLGEEDVPRGLSQLGDMTIDFDMKDLGVEEAGSGTAQMAMFAGPGQQEMVMSIVIALDDAQAVKKCLEQMDEMTVDQLQETFGMMGDFGGLEVSDLRALDVDGLGESAMGFGLTFEMPQMFGAADMQWVFFGRDSLLGMTMTMGMSGSAAYDAVSLAQVMDGKIKDVILQ